MMLHDAGISPASTPIATRFNIPVRVCMVCLGLKVPTNLFSMSRIEVDGIVYLLICFVNLYLGYKFGGQVLFQCYVAGYNSP